MRISTTSEVSAVYCFGNSSVVVIPAAAMTRNRPRTTHLCAQTMRRYWLRNHGLPLRKAIP